MTDVRNDDLTRINTIHDVVPLYRGNGDSLKKQYIGFETEIYLYRKDADGQPVAASSRECSELLQKLKDRGQNPQLEMASAVEYASPAFRVTETAQLNAEVKSAWQEYKSAIHAQGLIPSDGALLQGAKLQSDMELQKIELFKSQIQAWAEGINADKTRFDAYQVTTQGEVSKAQVLDAQARAFAAEVQAYGTKAGIETSVLDARLRAIGASVQKFTAQLQAGRDHVQAQSAVVQSRTQAFQADVQRYAAEVGAVNQQADVQVRASEATARNNMAYFEVLSRQFDSRMTRLLQEATIMQDILKSIAAMGSQLAAGAMSATHVQARISANAGTSLSASQSYNVGASVSDDGT